MKTSHGEPRPAERVLFLFGPLFVLGGFCVLELLLPGLTYRFAGWPLVASLFFVGMPHGATDLAVHTKLRDGQSRLRQLREFSGYVMWLFLSLICFITLPWIAVVCFLVLSATHFGVADARYLEKWEARNPQPGLRVWAAAARGLLTLSLPFAIAPEASIQIFEYVVALAGPTSIVPDPKVAGQIAVASVFFALSIQVAVAVRRIRSNDWRILIFEWVETAVLVLTFMTLHPLFAIGLYVIAWHSWRHLHALTAVLTTDRYGGGWRDIGWSILRMHVQSLPLLIPTIGVFLLLAWWRLDNGSAYLLATLTIAIFVVVTLPHHILVERLFTSHRTQREMFHWGEQS